MSMTIFFGDLNIENVAVVKSILRNFQLISKLKVNFHKSRFGGIRGSRKEVERYAM